jgi:lipopolysaccharide/colanic/teichoic acid biosynthesis glycosyltransferase
MPRFMDFLLLLLALPLLLPLALVSSLLVLVSFGRPILFKQTRGGFGGSRFEIYKFRTMTNARDAQGELLSDVLRTPPVGRFMRSSSLDELPALLNVLRGEMRIVGPRPFIAQYLPLYTPEQARRHEVRPGITGWAQVNGRNTLSWEEKFALDVWYVDNRSFLLDIRILAMTVWKVVGRSDIDTSADETMPVFRGSDPR